MTRQQVIKQYEKRGKKATEEQIQNALKRANGRVRIEAPAVVTKAKTSVAKPEPLSVEQRLDLERSKLEAKRDDAQKMVKAALERQRIAEEQNADWRDITSAGFDSFKIEPKIASGTSTATAFMIASDWHNEERVNPGDVNGCKNEYNLDVFHDRSIRFFQGGQRLWEIMQKDVHVPTIVLALLGDFITGHIHPDSAETNFLLPGPCHQ